MNPFTHTLSHQNYNPTNRFSNLIKVAGLLLLLSFQSVPLEAQIQRVPALINNFRNLIKVRKATKFTPKLPPKTKPYDLSERYKSFKNDQTNYYENFFNLGSRSTEGTIHSGAKVYNTKRSTLGFFGGMDLYVSTKPKPFKSGLKVQPGIILDDKPKSLKVYDGFGKLFSNKYDKSNFLNIKLIKLHDGGFAATLLTPSNKQVLIDGGHSLKDFYSLKDLIGTDNTNKELHIINTHTDKDHLRNILRLIEENNYYSHVLTPYARDLSVGKNQFKELSKVLANNAYLDISPDKSKVQLFSNSLTHDYEIRNIDQSDIYGIEVNELKLEKDFKLTLINRYNGANVNDRSFLVKAEHNGKRILITGDIGPPTIRKVTEYFANKSKKLQLEIDLHNQAVKASAFSKTTVRKLRLKKKAIQKTIDSDTDLEADILFWPHHYWTPKTTNYIVEFLQLVNPNYVVISKPTPQTRQSREKLISYLKTLKSEYPEFRFKIIDINKVSYHKGVEVFVDLNIYKLIYPWYVYNDNYRCSNSYTFEVNNVISD